ncbi:hypothetical protein RND81_10G064700 [Saponaria officinalis]|uniref:Uncharacterized protein n=1 Tax=Saponaria officinalis TaxID=3572 RepID=A0AAW1HZE2_SAPOF
MKKDKKRDLLVLELMLAISSLNNELGGENVGELSTIAITTTGSFLLHIVIVTASQQMSENQFRNKNTLLLVKLNRNTVAGVEDTDEVSLLINDDLNAVHLGIALLVVSSVDEDLIEDFVKD